MTRDTLFRIIIPSGLYAAFGVWAGVRLAAHNALIPYKVFNVIGYGLAILGVIVLSQVVVESERYKGIILNHVSEQIVGFLVFSGVAFVLYSMHWSQGPSAKVLEEFGPKYMMFFVLPSMMFLNIGVHGIDHAVPWSEKTRYTVLGAYLTGGGLLLQLYAAISDLFA